MKFIDWSTRTQVRRIGVSYVCASLLACVILCGPLSEIAAQPELDVISITILKGTLTLLICLFLCLHLAVYAWARRRNSTLRLQFGLKRLLMCSIFGSLLIGANFIEDPYSITRLVEPGMFKKSDPIFFGMPFESMRLVRDFNINALAFREYPNFIGLVLNTLFLLLFMANVLVLKFVKTENAASATESASHNASH